MELRVLIHLLWRKWWLLALIFVTTVSATFIFTIQQPVRYESKTTFVAKLNRALIEDRGLADALDILGRRTEIVTTYAEVIKSRRVRDLAAELLDLSPQQKNDLSVSSQVVAGTTIIELTVAGGDPALARDYAEMVGEATFSYVDNLYEMYELTLLDEATFGKPIKTNLILNLLIAAATSLILGCGLIFLPELISQWQQGQGGNPAAAILPETPHVLALQETLGALQAQLERSQQAVSKFYEDAAARDSSHLVETAPFITRSSLENGVDESRTLMANETTV